MKGLIYGVRCKSNGKWYIGQTINSLHARKLKHKKEHKYYDFKFYRAIRKYGWKNFEWHILERNPQNLDEAEIRWIEHFDSFNNGYNATIGGHNDNGSKMVEKKVVRNDGKVYESVSQAARANKLIHPSAISQALRTNGTSAGYAWKYFENWDGKPWPIPNGLTKAHNSKQIINDKGEIFESITSASKILGIPKSTIGQSIKVGCRGGGYYWKYYRGE